MHGSQQSSETSRRQRLALYALFFVWAYFTFRNSPGDDLSSSYIACHLLAEERQAHLYDFHPTLFHVVNSDAWISTASAVQFHGFLHPYVQTPSWALALRPACAALSFAEFKHLFLGLALFSVLAMIELVASAWARTFLRPIPLATLLVAIANTTPFTYAMWLVQTHAILLLATVAALYFAPRNKPITAGLLLAMACAVKITPGLLVIYWLVGGQRRAAASFIVWSIVLLALTIVLAGPSLTFQYFESIRRISNVLLVSYNNQSLAAWLGYSAELQTELTNWRILSLSTPAKAVSIFASIVGVAISGWLSRRHDWIGASVSASLIAITVTSPIAWTHYYIALIPAVMVLLDAGGVISIAAAIAAFTLNTTPVAIDPVAPMVTQTVVVRSHLISAVIALIALLSLLPKREGGHARDEGTQAPEQRLDSTRQRHLN